MTTSAADPTNHLLLRLALLCFGLWLTCSAILAGPLQGIGVNPDGTLELGRRGALLLTAGLFLAGTVLVGVRDFRVRRARTSVPSPARPAAPRRTSPALLLGLVPALLLVFTGLGVKAWMRRSRPVVDERVEVPAGTRDIREHQTSPSPGLYTGRLLHVAPATSRGIALAIAGLDPHYRLRFQGELQPNDVWAGEELATLVWVPWPLLGVEPADPVPFADTRYPWLREAPDRRRVLVRFVGAPDGALEVTELAQAR